MVLQTYLKKEYPLMTISKFKINTIKDPKTNQMITNLDASFLLTPYTYEPDYSRLYSAKIAKLIPRQINKILSNIFVMAEAKHRIDRDKIKIKINQFQRIKNYFFLAKKTSELLKTNTPKKVIEQLHVMNGFITTIQRNPEYANVDTFFLFFGALYWQQGLLLEFRTDLETYTKLSDDFTTASVQQKKRLYNHLRALEKKWCSEEFYTQTSIDLEEITKAHEYHGILYSVKLIQPSGERYEILNKKEPLGITNVIIHGGNTRKKRTK
jgi:hypothetical protein